jgi:hypothetical protein
VTANDERDRAERPQIFRRTRLCEERDSTGGTVTKLFFNQGEQISGTSYYLSRDHPGVREMTDSSGAIRVC